MVHLINDFSNVITSNEIFSAIFMVAIKWFLIPRYSDIIGSFYRISEFILYKTQKVLEYQSRWYLTRDTAQELKCLPHKQQNKVLEFQCPEFMYIIGLGWG